MTKIWKMGISPDNFISDTQDLTNEELGVYFRLLCYAWKKEAYLPKDHERLKRIGQGCNDKAINYLLKTLFREDEKGYYCKAQKEEFDWSIGSSIYNINEMIYANVMYPDPLRPDDKINDIIRLHTLFGYVGIGAGKKHVYHHIYTLNILEEYLVNYKEKNEINKDIYADFKFSFYRKKFQESIFSKPLLWTSILIIHQLVNDLLNCYDTFINYNISKSGKNFLKLLIVPPCFR